MENRYAFGSSTIEGQPIWLFDPYKLRFDKLDFDEIAGDDGHNGAKLKRLSRITSSKLILIQCSGY